MKPAHLKYYERYSAAAPFVFMLSGVLTRSNVRKLAGMHRHRDYVALGKRPDLLPLHHAMNAELLAAREEWDTYDYGEGYFYQGLDLVGVTGLRDTRGRVNAMGLPGLVAGKSVLEIGCNSGFLSLSLADSARRVVGFDINPHLIRIGELAAEHLDIGNVELAVSSFEDFGTDERFEVVLSFANHSTYDQNTRQSLEQYFRRCADLLAPGGLLLFESHPPHHEGEGLEDVCRLLGELFEVEDRSVLDYGTYLDRGRTFVVARQRADA